MVVLHKRRLTRPRVVQMGLLAAAFLSVGLLGYRSMHHSFAASNCPISNILVDACHPWIGAAAMGDPHAAPNAEAQFLYAEKQIGRTMDIFHDYHSPGNLPLNSTEKYFAERPNTYVYVNWKPASNWADADGGNATVNASIDRAAASIKSVAPHKIFLTVWHEPGNDVSGGTSCPIKPGSAGTPAQYRAMWQNVENRFKADGVTNVVWVMNYMGYSKWDCLVPQLWPGNGLIDWVTFDVYSMGDSSTVANTIGRFYNVLLNDNNSSFNVDAKPWGLAEWGDCTTSDQAHVYQYYQEMKTALDNNTYPRLKMYMVYDSNGNGAGMGCLTDYSKSGVYDPTEQAYYNKFADDPHFFDPSSPSPPTIPGNLHVTNVSPNSIAIAWNASTDSAGVAGYRVYRDNILISTQTSQTRVDSSLKSNTSYTYTVRAYSTTGSVSGAATVTARTTTLPVPGGGGPGGSSAGSGGSGRPSSLQSLSNGTSVGGSLAVGGSQTTVIVDGKFVSKHGQLNTTYLTNGEHIVTTKTKNANGTVTTATRIIDVQNNLNTWQTVRNLALSALRTYPILLNKDMWTGIAVAMAGVGFVLYFFVYRRPFYRTLQKKLGGS